jgi:thioredoxin-related protein
MLAKRLSVLAVSLYWLVVTGAVRAEDVQWRHDYDAARREAYETHRPLLLDFGTADCFWCKKLDATTFRAPAIVRLLNERFIPLKQDGERDRAITAALNIQAFPTLVLAAPDGRLLAVHPGYLDTAKMQDLLQRVIAAATPVAQFPEAQGLLTQAREAYAARQYLRCLDHCVVLSTGYAELPEAAEAKQLAAAIRTEPEPLEQACNHLSERLAGMYLELAEAWLKKGRPEQAESCLERVVQLLPEGPTATRARQQLARLREK